MKVKHMVKGIEKIAELLIPMPIIKYFQHRTIYEPRMRHLKISESNAPLFDSVFFEVRTKCNGTCTFCPASVLEDIRDDASMSMGLYKKVIAELKGMQFSGRIAYHVNNDPLIFPQLSEFVAYARQNLPKAWIQILTNGKALTLEVVEKLLRAGINELSINYYNDIFTAELPRVFREIRDSLLPKFYKPEQIKTGHGPDPEDKTIFRFNIFRRKVNRILTNRAGTAPNKEKKSTWPRGFCEYPFTQFNITADGRVSKCCADFYFSDSMGDLNKESILDIWNGKKFNNIRRLLLKGNRDAIEICKKCDFYGSKKIYSHLARFIYILTREYL